VLELLCSSGTEREAHTKAFNINAFTALKKDKRIALLGMVQSLFEASMYIFVFMWTPVLEELVKEFKDPEYGLHGIVFSIYMVCIMVGSSIFSITIKRHEPETLLSSLLLVAFANFLITGLFISHEYLVLNCFLIFEICVGVYFPTIATIRSAYIPEESRSAVMNLFRIPLNLLVVMILLWINLFDNETIFFFCSLFQLVAFILQYLILQLNKKVVPTEEEIEPVVNVNL